MGERGRPRGRTGGWTGGWTGGRTRGRTGGVRLGIGLGSDWGSDWGIGLGGLDWGGRTGDRTGGSDKGVGLGGSDWGWIRWLVKFPKFHFDLLTCHPTWTSSIQRVLVWVK